MNNRIQIQFSGVNLSFGRKEVFHSLDFTFSDSEKVLIHGPSGSGKTTLLQLISGLQFPTSGSVSYSQSGAIFETRDLCFPTFRNKSLAITFSEPLFFENLSVEGNLMFPFTFLGKNYRNEWKEKLLSLLKVDLLLHSPMKILSSGEKDRINIIRALLYDDPIVLLDEPGAHMDSALFQNFINLLEEYIEYVSPTIIIVSHSDAFNTMVDRIFICENGLISEKK